jgi:Fe-S-cluster containining protein
MFESITRSYSDLMPCKLGCDDCCHVYYELSFIEAFYISGMFNDKISGRLRERAIIRAQEAEPLFHDAQVMLGTLGRAASDLGESEVIDAAARLRIRCPLLEDKRCILYEDRPITCRLYGCPQKVGNRVVTCPRSRFQEGTAYSTIDVNEVQKNLTEYSLEFLLDLLEFDVACENRLRFTMPQVLRTVFDKEYFTCLQRAIC